MRVDTKYSDGHQLCLTRAQTRRAVAHAEQAVCSLESRGGAAGRAFTARALNTDDLCLTRVYAQGGRTC